MILGEVNLSLIARGQILWHSKFSVIWNGSWRIRNGFENFWVSFHVTINLSYKFTTAASFKFFE